MRLVIVTNMEINIVGCHVPTVRKACPQIQGFVGLHVAVFKQAPCAIIVYSFHIETNGRYGDHDGPDYSPKYHTCVFGYVFAYCIQSLHIRFMNLRWLNGKKSL